MTWPEVDRTEPAFVGGEREMLEEWLDFHRATLLRKCAGLSGAQLAERSVPPSGLSLLGLVRHMADVERCWFRRYWSEDWQETVEELYDDSEDVDVDLNDTDPARADEDLARYLDQVAKARAESARHELDDTVIQQRGTHQRTVSLRWIYLHMIEEYARHNGHADLLRERIDGVTGD